MFHTSAHIGGMGRTIYFTNYGRTPAILNEVAGSLKYHATEPARLERSARGTLPKVNIAIGSGGTFDPQHFDLEANPEEISRALGGDGFILLIAVIWYYDVMDHLRETGICWQYNHAEQQFLARPSNNLNYHT